MLISEVAKLAGLSKDGVRHYEELGLITSTPRKAGSKVYREYAPAVIDTIRNIREVKKLGLTLREITPLAKNYAKNPPTKEQMVEFLESRLAFIQERISSLRDTEAYIANKLQRYRDQPE